MPAARLRRNLALWLPFVGTLNTKAVSHLWALNKDRGLSGGDIVFVGHWQAFAAAKEAKKRFCCRIIYDLAELSAEELAYSWHWRAFIRKLVVDCENQLLRSADQVVSVTPKASLYLYPWHRIYRTTLFVPNLVLDSSECDAPAAKNGILLYVGGIRPLRGLETAIKALAHLPAKMQFDCVGYGQRNYQRKLRRLAGRLGVSSRVNFLPAVAPDKLVTFARDYSCAIATLEPFGQQHKEAQPNKVFIYLKAQVPFVVTADSRLARQLSGADFATCVKPNSPKELAQAITRLMGAQSSVPKTAYATFKKHIKAADFDTLFKDS